MRLTYDQARLLEHAFEAVEEVRAGSEPHSLAWVEVHPLEVPDLHDWIAVRFPASAWIAGDVEEGEPEGPRMATGVFVVIVDGDGEVVAAKHSAAGRFEMRRGFAVPLPGCPVSA